MKKEYEKPEVCMIKVQIERGFAGSEQGTYEPFSMDGYDDQGEVGM